MIKIKTESIIGDSLVRRRYEVSVVDLLGDEHKEVVGMFNHRPDNDGSEVELSYLASKKNYEQEFYILQIKDAINPFQTSPLRWNTRSEMLKVVLDLALSSPASDPFVLNGLPYMQYVTDDEIKALYGKDQSWVDDVRLKISELLSSKAIVDAYKPVLEL